MTIDDLQTLIRTEVLADEPPFQMTSPSFVAAGKRAVRRRRLGWAAGVAGIVAVAGIAWVGLHTAGENVPDAAQQVLDEFDPTTFPTIVDSVVREAVGSALPDRGLIEPTLEGYTRLRPEDYAYTDAWTAWYDLAPEDELMVILQNDPSANEGNEKKNCRRDLDAGEAERCSVDRLPDGSITITSVLEMNRARDGFRPAKTGDPESRWFMRQVFNPRDYGYGVIAREYVKAHTLAQADAHWSVNPQQLTEIASSPRLVYEMPHGPKKDCNTTFLLPRTEMGYARVVCENTLNQ